MLKLVIASSLSFLWLVACNISCGGSHLEELRQIPPQIITVPQDITLDPGQSPTFMVTAEGTPPLHYQWKWNNLIIAGETGNTVTLPKSVPSDNQTFISVTISNDFGAVTSSAASLYIRGGTRAPKFGDLRFKDVGAFPIPLESYLLTNVIGGTTREFQNLLGTPLELSAPGPSVSLDMSWSVLLFKQPIGISPRTTTYQSGYLDRFQSDINSIVDKNSVISSLDLCQEPNVYAIQVIREPGSLEYSLGGQTLALENLQMAANEEGVGSRVITAISINSGLATYISYGWQGDTTTVYEAKVLTASSSTVGNVAANLSQQGYILTAIGGNTRDGFIMIGTRVKGETVSRPLLVWSPNTTITVGRGYSYVGHIYIPSLVNSNPGNELWILQQ